MGSTRKIEILVGVFMLLALVAFLVLAIKISNLGSVSSGETYSVTAHFDNVGGLRQRAQVTLSGVRVGRVSEIRYDQKTFRAVVTLRIQSDIDFLPVDTQASIYTAGLLGEQYISLEPGAEDELLTDGSNIDITQSAIVLEEIIGKVLVDLTTK